MEKIKSGKWAFVVLGIILLVSLGLHVIRISYPDRPVFDEAHFATYAADYVKDQVFFDIHPPLGKLIYASVIPLALRFENDVSLGNTTFVRYTHSPTGTVYYATGLPYGNFPYIPLRLIAVFFGLALTAAFYFFLRAIGVGEVGALLGAFFATFENALLLETKLILMNGMYLAFGFAALAAWFGTWPKGYDRRAVLAGFLFALSLGVKLIGIIFIGPILLSFFIPDQVPDHRNRTAGNFKKFIVTAIIVFVAVSFLNFLFFSPSRILSFSKSIGIKFPAPTNLRATDFLAYAMTTIVPWTGYLVGGPQAQGSPWYDWPLMRGVMTYYYAPGNAGNLVLRGNPAVWYASTAAVIVGIILLLWKVLSSRGAEGSFLRMTKEGILRVVQNDRIILILFAGYFFSLLPFFTFVRRGTFLYHYFPAYLFAIGLLVYFISRWLGLNTVESISKKQWFWLAEIAALIIIGFFYAAPLTYGF